MAIDLSAIKKGPRVKPPKVLLYGVGGIGKTTFFGGDPFADPPIIGAPDPVFLMTEEGQGRLDLARFELRPDDPILRTWDELLECVSALYTQGHDYKTAVLDSADFAQPLLFEFTAKQHGKEDIEAFGYGKGYLHAENNLRVLLDGLDALRRDKNMAIGIIAHTEAKKFEDPEAESYDRWKLRMHDRLAALIHDWADTVLFARWKTHVVKDKESFNQERRRGVGRGERIMLTQERPGFWAKNRYGLPYELPLDWMAFQNAIVPPGQAPAIDATEPETETQPDTEKTEAN